MHGERRLEQLRLSVATHRDVATAVVEGPLPQGVASVGFRPENVEVMSADAVGGVPATVRHVAIVTGGQLLVNLRSGELDVKAKLPWDTSMDLQPGFAVKWSVDSTMLRMFDADGIAIRIAHSEA